MRTHSLPGCASIRKSQHGSALLIILAIIGIGAAFLLVSALNKANSQIERDKITTDVLAQAKAALIGYAITYADTHPSEVNGPLLLPDLGSTRNTSTGEGVSAGNFAGNAANLSVVGRLPWKSLGLAPLRDGKGECLWYAVSGAFQDAQKTALMNWDTLGQFDTYTSDGTPGGTVSTVGNNYHQRPVAVIFAPGTTMAGQNRTIGADAVTGCGGNYNARNYLDTFNADPVINGIVNYFANLNSSTGTYLFASPKSLVLGPVTDASGNTLVNDRILTITPGDLFRAIARRSDFAAFVSTELVNVAKKNLSALPPPGTIDFTNPLPIETSGGVTAGSLEIGRVPASALTSTPLRRWQDNLLYAKCASGASCLTVNGSPCKGIVIFAGERTSAQTRATNAQKNTWSNYLEGSVLAAFNAGAAVFSGASAYSAASPSTDVLACISTIPGAQVSFAANLGSFTAAGSGVTVDTVNRTVAVATSGGSGGGCFWYPAAIPLSGKTLRAHYDFTFTNADTFANADPLDTVDNGNGFTFSLLRGDSGAPTSCGTRANMGAFDSSTLLGFTSFLVETDVHHDTSNNDPAGNHIAIMYSGNLTHSSTVGGNGYTTSACDGTAQGCLHSPANKFEESPTPLTHNQRIEIHTGYSDATCTSLIAGGAYVQIKTWLDCTSCNDTTTDFSASSTISRCIAPDPALATVYFGFTGGFTGGANPQGVVIQNLDLRTQ